ncbi:hypothetical protein Q7P37_001954 [Cladosporium fusiforme]
MASLPFDYSALNGLRREDGLDIVELQNQTKATAYITGVGRVPGDEDLLLKNGVTTSTGASLNNDSGILVPQDKGKARRLQGWRFGVALSAAVAICVLVTNCILTVWASLRFPLEDGMGTAFVGECSTANTWALWLHILINALSSILLSASNYTMQCLSSPTRKECDKAHARGDWLDIGVAGVRNLSRISWRRRVLWVLLGFSSVPIHLLYNSAIFKTLDANQFQVIVANNAFFEGRDYDLTFGQPPDDGFNTTIIPDSRYDNIPTIHAIRDAYNANSTMYETLEPRECIDVYGKDFISGHSHVFVMTLEDGIRANNTVFFNREIEVTDGDPPGWICSDIPSRFQCNIPAAKNNATNWVVAGKKIDHCLAKRTERRCKLQFSTQILIAVIVCNAVKSFAMLWTFYRQREETLVTVGDSIASWLDVPDEMTKGRCLNSKKSLQKGPTRWQLQDTPAKSNVSARDNPPAFIANFAPNLWPWLSSFRLAQRRSPKTTYPNTNPPPVAFTRSRPLQWRHAVSPKRWALSMTLCISTLIITAVLLTMGLGALYGRSLLDMGFGSLSADSMIETDLPSTGSTGLISSVLLANTPQAIVSFLYLLYNGLFTCMHLAHEYSGYAVQRRPLRVTAPAGAQRSTYWLQLPYTYGIPLIVASATLHWLISQAIFLARIHVYIDGVEDVSESVSAVGFSCPPIVCLIVLGTVMLAVAVGMGFRKLQSAMPVAGSCSVIIAAATHGADGDGDAPFLPVKWGAVDGKGDGEVGHCCFTSGEVVDLVEGKMYAGGFEGELSDGLKRRI